MRSPDNWIRKLFGKRLTALGAVKAIGLGREIAIVAVAHAKNAAVEANCYFIASQAAMLLVGGGRRGAWISVSVFIAYACIQPAHLIFFCVVAVPFLLWPSVNASAYGTRGLRGVIALSIVFNTLAFIEIVLAARLRFHDGGILTTGFPLASLYSTVFGGALVFGLGTGVKRYTNTELAVVAGLCSIRLFGVSWLSGGMQWLLLIAVRIVEIIVPQWITYRRIGISRS
jgi:magnesium-transporting ATPase (P-type)